MPGPADSLLAKVTEPGAITDVPNALEGALQEIFATGARAWAAGETGAEVDAAVEASAGLVDIGLVPILVLGYGLLVLLTYIERILLGLAGFIPWVGSKVQSWIKLEFSPIVALKNLIDGLARRIVANLFQSAINLISFFVPIAFPQITATKTTGGQPVNLTDVYQKLAALNGWDVHLQYDVNRLNSRVFGTIPVTGAPSPTLEEQVLALQSQVDHQASTLTSLSTQVAHIDGVLAQVQHELSTLLGQLHGIRAVEVGWQDIVNQVVHVQQQLQQVQTIQGNDINRQTNQLIMLWPLTLLLQPGAKGLENLRKLEDNPCQCPQLPGIPNELGTALALMEFIENG